MNLTEQHYNRIIELAKQYGAKKLILSDSTLEDPETANDLDLATDIAGWDIFGFGAKVEDEMKILVDVGPLTQSNSFTRLIEKNGKILYEAG